MSEVRNGENLFRKFFVQVTKEWYACVIVPEFWYLVKTQDEIKDVKCVSEKEVKEILARRQRGETVYSETKRGII